MQNLLWVMSVFAFAGATVLRVVALDPAYVSRPVLPPENLASPGRQALSLVSFEHPLGVADLVWLRVCGAIGPAAEDVRSPEWNTVLSGAHTATDLDPNYEVIYDAAATVMAVWGERADEAEALLLKGSKDLPESWRLRLLLGYINFFMRNDAVQGADWFQRAAEIPGAPRYLAALAGRLRFYAGDEEGAVRMLESMVDNLVGPAKEDAIWRLKALRSEPRLRRFDAACEATRLKLGRLPSLEEVLASGLVSEAPVDEFGGTLFFDENCQAKTSEISRRAKDLSRTPMDANQVEVGEVPDGQ
ncbi:MAG: hypothetical protein IPG45_01215 [Deltaproteobacteria bacterium]|nr:hypothetical protein [Deltaproteobacteria bacterium]